MQALHLAAGIFAEARLRGFNLKLLDTGGGFPAHYDDTVPAVKNLAKTINAELERLFPEPLEILAEPGRFLIASAATSVAKIIGTAIRGSKQHALQWLSPREGRACESIARCCPLD